jgi:hypothetical protein
MGYQVASRTIRVRLTGTDFEGAEARLESVPVGRYLEYRKLPATDQRLLDLFAEHLLDWNLEDGDTPVPANRDSFDQLDSGLLSTFAVAWLQKVTEAQQPRFIRPDPAAGGEPVGNGAVEIAAL